MLHGQTNVPLELSFTTMKAYSDISSEVELDVVFNGPDGGAWRVPAFWSGGSEFRVRFSASKPGRYRYRSIASDPGNRELHDKEGELEIAAYDGANELFRHGNLRVASTKRTLEHEDGTPFFWLADTWWMGLCQRLGWPGDFRTLAADRVAKGFTAIQIVAGLNPDMPPFDPRAANEAGFPWEKDYARTNPAYFDAADLRINWLVRSGLVPCIVGAWGYHLSFMGMEKMKKHWRYLVARWGAYPVVWCAAGEVVMAYYLSKTKEKDQQFHKKGWTELTSYIRQIDPYHRLVTVHPGHKGREQIEDQMLMDFQMLQTGHGDMKSVPVSIRDVTDEWAREPRMPVLVAEACYEGIGEANRQQVQRYQFWGSVLCGAMGHTYGANGIWQANTREKPYGQSPHGMSWGNTPWDEAMRLPGSTQLGLGRRLLERYQWWRFEPHPEWVEPHWTKENYVAPWAAGIPGEVRVIFVPLAWGTPTVKGIEQGVTYRAYLFNPVDATEHDLGPVRPDSNGDWLLPLAVDTYRNMPIFQDWVLVLERVKTG